MLENLSTTQTLAALLGLYFLAAGAGLYINRKDVAVMFKEMIDQPALGYLGGVIAFAVGSAIIAVHNDWSGMLSGFVSLIGWFALAEGVLMLACRKWFLGLFARWTISERFSSAMGWAIMAAGALLMVAGLAG